MCKKDKKTPDVSGGAKWEEKMESGPVSRVLSSLRRGSHSSGACLTACLKRPTRARTRARSCGQKPRARLFGLAPDGVYPATSVTRRAVRSYRTLSPLPVLLSEAIGGLLSVALSVASRRPAVSWHPALWCPDFPLTCVSGCPARFHRRSIVTDPPISRPAPADRPGCAAGQRFQPQYRPPSLPTPPLPAAGRSAVRPGHPLPCHHL